jgi:hypothetical protein
MQLENLQEDFFLRAQTLVISSNSMPPTQHDLPTHKHFLHSLVLGCVRKYSCATCGIASFFLAPTSSDITSIFTTLHPKWSSFFPLFLEDYKPSQNLEFSFNFFKLTFQHMSNLSSSGPSRMVFEPSKFVFIQKLLQMHSHICFNFVFISHKVTFHIKLHISLKRPTF